MSSTVLKKLKALTASFAFSFLTYFWSTTMIFLVVDKPDDVWKVTVYSPNSSFKSCSILLIEI